MNFRARNREVANALNRPKEVLTRPLHRLIQTTLSSQRAWGKKLLSLVTFFAAAKKVTPPPGRRLLKKKPKQEQPLVRQNNKTNPTAKSNPACCHNQKLR